MPLQDFLAGAALLVVMLLAVSAATALVVRRRLRHLDRLELALASVVVGTAVLIAVHLVPLMLGILNRATVLAAAALGIGLAALVRPAAAAAAAVGEDRPPPQQSRPGSGRASWALAATASAAALVFAVADLGRWAGDELVGVDPLTFHLPDVGRWIQLGSVWQIDQFLPLLAHGYYPNNGDVVLLSTVLPWHNDFLVRLPITFFLALTAVAVGAVARELRAPPAAAVLAGAAAVSIPIAGLATIPRALPDSLLWATFACALLFLLRHARTRRRSDLVLAGIALGIACGTKWYGVSSVAVVVAIWIAARLAARRGRGDAGRVLRDGVLVGGLALLGTAVWFARNLVEVGNPVFPLRIAPLGVTIFDAPPDVLRAQVGLTLADYAGDPGVWGQLAGELHDGLGLIPLAVAVALIAAVALAARGPGGDRRVLTMAVAAAALGLLYTVTPATALGLPGDPSLASVNTRYALPALIVALAVAAWVAGRLPRAAALALEAALAAAAIGAAHAGYEVRGLREPLLAALALVLLGAAGWALWRSRRRPLVLAAGALAAALVALAGAHRVQDRINDGRYRGIDTAVDVLLDVAPSGRRIGLAGNWSIGGLSPIWPSFGTRIGNDVEYVGEFVDGFLRGYGDAASFRAALERERYDALVVGRGFFPPQDTREQRWAAQAGWRTIALSPRLRVLVPPAPR